MPDSADVVWVDDSSRLGVYLFACLSVTACGGGVLQGSRPATASDRSAKRDGAYVCESPLTFTVDDGKVFEPSEAKEQDGDRDAVVYVGASGPVLVEGKSAVTNQWVSEDGDQHFFAWQDAGRGVELIVARHRRGATRVVWASQPGDPGAYETKTFPDGTTRPLGLPTLVESCTPREIYDELRREGRRPFLAVQAMPAPGVVGGKGQTLEVAGCQRPGQEPPNGAKTPDWLWSPSKLLVVEGPQRTAYLSFDRPSADPAAVWAVPVSADGVFGAQMGVVRFQGKLLPGSRAHVTSEVTTLANATLDCAYGTR